MDGKIENLPQFISIGWFEVADEHGVLANAY